MRKFGPLRPKKPNKQRLFVTGPETVSQVRCYVPFGSPACARSYRTDARPRRRKCMNIVGEARAVRGEFRRQTHSRLW